MAKEPMNDDTWVEFVAGRAQGIIAVLLALLDTHPDPAYLLERLKAVEQAALVNVEPTLLSDRYIEGMRDPIDRARKILDLRLAQ